MERNPCLPRSPEDGAAVQAPIGLRFPDGSSHDSLQVENKMQLGKFMRH